MGLVWIDAVIRSRFSVDGGSSPFMSIVFKAPHHLLLNGLPEPPHRSGSPPVAWGSQPYGSREPGGTGKHINITRLIKIFLEINQRI